MGQVTLRNSGKVYDEDPKPILGDRIVTADLAPSASYATGGETLQAGLVGLSNIKNISSGMFTTSGTYLIYAIFDAEGLRPTVKLKFIVFATGAELANATDISAQRFRATVLGE